MTDLTPLSSPEDDALDGVERELLEGEAARLASDEAGVNRMAAQLVVQRFRAGERRRRVLLAGGSALSLAAAVALVFGLARPGTQAASAHAGPALQQSSLLVESGSVTVPGAGQLGRGVPVAAATLVELSPATCLRSGSHVRLCSGGGGAQLKLPALGGAWDVELAAGAVKVDLEAMPAGFSIRTLHGVASVEGTLFSIELDASRAFTTVMVERGRVRVTNQRLGEQALLVAGQQARLGERLDLSGRSPEATPLGSLDSSPLVEAPSDTPPAAQHGAATPAPHKKSASELLEEARHERGAGHYAQAAQRYRKLVQQHPESAEARASLVSLGQLELGQLGQPEAALRSFQTYLARPGQLRQEAEHGAISALQRLGRKADERRAIEAFLARYPKSTQAGALSQRLKQL